MAGIDDPSTCEVLSVTDVGNESAPSPHRWQDFRVRWISFACCPVACGSPVGSTSDYASAYARTAMRLPHEDHFNGSFLQIWPPCTSSEIAAGVPRRRSCGRSEERRVGTACGSGW